MPPGPPLFHRGFDREHPLSSAQQTLIAYATHLRASMRRGVGFLHAPVRAVFLSHGPLLWGLALLLAGWRLSANEGVAAPLLSREVDGALGEILPQAQEYYRALRPFRELLRSFVDAAWNADQKRGVIEASHHFAEFVNGMGPSGAAWVAALFESSGFQILVSKLADKFSAPAVVAPSNS